MDEPHPAYDFFAPRPLPGYDGNPNNMNGWIEADVPLLGVLGRLSEPLGVEVDEPMVNPVIDELAEPIVEGTRSVDGTRHTPLMPLCPHRALRVIEDLCTRMGNLEYGHGFLVKKVIMVSDAEVADSIAIREIGPRVSTMEDQMQVMASQMVQVVSKLEQGQQAVTQRDETIAVLSQQCIFGMDRRLADLERRPSGPQ
ncbi:hypothetical protein Tco_1335929 [Tanacetum coccineum]